MTRYNFSSLKDSLSQVQIGPVILEMKLEWANNRPLQHMYYSVPANLQGRREIIKVICCNIFGKSFKFHTLKLTSLI